MRRAPPVAYRGLPHLEGTGAMSTALLFANAAFDSETTAILASAFDTAWEAVRISGGPLAEDGNASSTRERLAKRIIVKGQAGERDAKRLVDDALANLGISR
jgi:hypothetical protein